MTDLYLQKPTHTEEEERHYTELALRLIERVDAKTCAVIASKLATYPNAPKIVQARLARVQLAQKSELAQRPHESAPSSGHKTAAHELSRLFHSASTEERRLILLNLRYSPIAPAKPVDKSIAQISVQRLEAAALGHNVEVFVREIERTLGIFHTQVRRLIDDPSGEPIVVLAKVLQMSEPVLQRVLLCLNPSISQSVQRVYDLANLYENIEQMAALRLVAIWQSAYGVEKKLGAPQVTSTPQRTIASDPRPRVAVAAARPKSRWQAAAQQGKKTDSA